MIRFGDCSRNGACGPRRTARWTALYGSCVQRRVLLQRQTRATSTAVIGAALDASRSAVGDCASNIKKQMACVAPSCGQTLRRHDYADVLTGRSHDRCWRWAACSVILGSLTTRQAEWNLFAPARPQTGVGPKTKRRTSEQGGDWGWVWRSTTNRRCNLPCHGTVTGWQLHNFWRRRPVNNNPTQPDVSRTSQGGRYNEKAPPVGLCCWDR